MGDQVSETPIEPLATAERHPSIDRFERLIRSSQYDDALAVLSSLPEDALTSEWCVLCAEMYFELFHFTLAGEFARRATKLAPTDPRALFIHSLMWPAERNAAVSLMKMLAPSCAFTLAATAINSAREDAVSMARTAYRQAPDQFHVASRLVHALFHWKQYNEGLEVIAACKRRWPESAWLDVSAATMLDELGQHRDAERLVKAVLDRLPDYRFALHQYGFYLLANARGRRLPASDPKLALTLALDCLTRARPDGFFDRLDVDIAECLGGLGRWGEALALLDEVRSRGSSDWKRFGTILYGSILLENDRSPAAASRWLREILPDALEEAFYDPRTHTLSATALKRIGNDQLAEKSAAHAAALTAGRELSAHDIAMFFEHIGDMLPQNPNGFR